MKTLFVLGTKQLRENHNPHQEYINLLHITFKKLYADSTDQTVMADLPSGYGSILKSAFVDPTVDDLFILPIDTNNFDIVNQIKVHAQENNLALVANITEPASHVKDYYELDPSYLYLNLKLIRSIDNIDWGDYFDIGSSNHNVHLNYPQTEAGAYVYAGSEIANQIVAKNGWILFNRVLGIGGRIGQWPTSVTVKTVTYYSELIQHLVEIDSAKFAEILNSEQQQYFTITKTAMLEQWNKETEERLVFKPTIETEFRSQDIVVENFYMISDYEFKGLQFLKTLNKDNETRLVFLHTNADIENNIKNILLNWDGTNTSSIFDDQNIINQLNSFYSAYTPTEFTEFWNYCKSVYHMHFPIVGLNFIEDIESQCHVNNIVWAGRLGNYPLILKASNLQLAATEFIHQSVDNKFAVVKVGPRYYKKNFYKQFKMTFRNTQTNEQQTVRYNLKQHLLAQKWARANQFDYLEQECLAEKNYMLQHWEYQPGNPNARDIPALCAELNRYVKIINDYFDGSSERRVKYYITQYFDPATLDQNILNEIHHHFELLIGQVWNVSEYFKKADWPTTFAIRQLNNLCHEMESLRKPSVSQTPRYWSSFIYFPFLPGYRYKFIESDYDHFERNRYFGDLFLHYAQLGKTPLEAWYGRDEVVFDENITGLRYLSGEFVVNFTDDISDEEQLKIQLETDRDFFPWLRSRGQDPESKFTSVGNIPIGKFERTDFPGLTASEIMIKLFEYDDIYKLELTDHNDTVVAEKTLDYTWKDVLDKTDPTRSGK